MLNKYANFRFLREIFEKEFVHKPFTSQDDLLNSSTLLEQAGVLRSNNEVVSIENYESTRYITQTVEVTQKLPLFKDND